MPRINETIDTDLDVVDAATRLEGERCLQLKNLFPFGLVDIKTKEFT